MLRKQMLLMTGDNKQFPIVDHYHCCGNRFIDFDYNRIALKSRYNENIKIHKANGC